MFEMTLEEIRNCTKEVLTPSDVSEVLNVHPYSLNKAKREGTLEFKAFFIGKNLKIPRIPFLNYMEVISDEKKYVD